MAAAGRAGRRNHYRAFAENALHTFSGGAGCLPQFFWGPLPVPRTLRESRCWATAMEMQLCSSSILYTSNPSHPSIPSTSDNSPR